MTQANINPLILRWARERAELTVEETARRIRLKPERLEAWERGESLPTFHQAQELARALYLPFGYLFLSRPPLTTLPITDFRLLPENQKGKFSPDLEDTLNDARRKSDWLRERRIALGHPPLSFVGRFSTNTPAQIISDDIRNVLNLPLPTARDAKTWKEHLRILCRHAEQAGIVVLQSGYVGSNTHRTLSVKEFRGFALADPYAPLIFINAKDSVNGRIFTLAHELGHLWTGTSGVSNPEPAQPGIERLCNQVAAELLVPEKLLKERWQRGLLSEEKIEELAREFRVSALVILIQGYETGLLAKQEFQQAVQTMQERSTAESQPYPRHGRLFPGEIAQAVREGAVLYKDAASLLNVKPKTLEQFRGKDAISNAPPLAFAHG